MEENSAIHEAREEAIKAVSCYQAILGDHPAVPGIYNIISRLKDQRPAHVSEALDAARLERARIG